MKRMLKKMLAVIMVMCLAAGLQTAALATPVNGNQTADGTASDSDDTQLPEIKGFKHVSRGKTTVTIGWDDVDEASMYYVRWGIYDAEAKAVSEEVSTDTPLDPKITIKDIPKGGFAVLAVFAYDGGMNELASGTYIGLPSIPAVKKIEYGWVNGKLAVAFAPGMAVDDYYLTLYSAKGKKLQTVKAYLQADGTVYATFSKTNLKNCYKVKVVPRFTMEEDLSAKVDFKGKAKTFICVPQPVVTSTKKDVKKNSVTIRWKKVKKAKKYTIYVATSTKKNAKVSELNFKKVKTVSSKKTKYTLKKFQGKKVNTNNQTYYFRIVTTAKVGKKTVKSGKREYYWAYTKVKNNVGKVL